MKQQLNPAVVAVIVVVVVAIVGFVLYKGTGGQGGLEKGATGNKGGHFEYKGPPEGMPGVRQGPGGPNRSGPPAGVSMPGR